MSCYFQGLEIIRRMIRTIFPSSLHFVISTLPSVLTQKSTDETITLLGGPTRKVEEWGPRRH